MSVLISRYEILIFSLHYSRGTLPVCAPPREAQYYYYKKGQVYNPSNSHVSAQYNRYVAVTWCLHFFPIFFLAEGNYAPSSLVFESLMLFAFCQLSCHRVCTVLFIRGQKLLDGEFISDASPPSVATSLVSWSGLSFQEILMGLALNYIWLFHASLVISIAIHVF